MFDFSKRKIYNLLTKFWETLVFWKCEPKHRSNFIAQGNACKERPLAHSVKYLQAIFFKMENSVNNREFKGVWIPREIWLDTRLNALEKAIFAEIDSLDNEATGCFASNKYLADFCQCSETKVSGAISKLIKIGYIYVKSFDGRQRVLKSRFSKIAGQTYKICKAETQNQQDNNKKNNTLNNSLNIAEQVLYYLNEKAETHFKPVESNLKFIKARLKDYTESDLKAVVDKKTAEWKGTQMQMYLRPETLFNATKFESYINGLTPIKEQAKGKEPFKSKDYTKQELDEMVDDIDDVEF